MAPRGEVHFPSKDLPKARRSTEGHSSFGDMTEALQGVPIHLTLSCIPVTITQQTAKMSKKSTKYDQLFGFSPLVLLFPLEITSVPLSMVYVHMETDTKKKFFLMHENTLPLT